MMARGAGRVIARRRGAVMVVAVLGCMVGPALSVSAHPLRLEPGRWYTVSPAQAATAAAAPTSAAFSAVLATAGQSPEIQRFARPAPRANETFSAGSAVWLAVFGCMAILAASLFRSTLFGFADFIRRSRHRAAVYIKGSK